MDLRELKQFIDENNATFERFGVNNTEQIQWLLHYIHVWTTVVTVYDIIQYVCIALGIPGNILSAIVWLRLHVASKNSSAVYLAALAINDLVFLLDKIFYYTARRLYWPGWPNEFYWFVYLFADTYEPFLVLGFSVERLIAICCPLKVGRNGSILVNNHYDYVFFRISV